MSGESLIRGNAAHPAPERGRVSLGMLALAVLGAPIAWAVQILIAYGFSSYVCFPGDVPAGAPLVGWAWSALLVLSVLAILLATVAGLVAHWAWRRTRHERSDRSGSLLETGIGRTRFVAASGTFISIVFLVLLLFDAATVFIVPMCSY